MREALQAAARETLRPCRPSKPAQAGLEPRASAPRGRCACGPAKPVPRLMLGWRVQGMRKVFPRGLRGPCW